MGHIDRDTLKQLASRYIWWETPDEALDMPERVIAQVMAIGDYADVQQLVHLVGDDVLREVIAHAQAGQFDQRPDGHPNSPLAIAEDVMTRYFRPRMDLLPPARQRLWPELRPAAEFGFARAPRHARLNCT